MSLYCFLWKTCDHTYIYTAEVPSLLMALISIIQHQRDWAAFGFRALDNLLIHSDDRVQAPRMLGNQIYVYYL